MKIGFPISLSIVFWSLIGLIRFYEEKSKRKRVYITKSLLLKERKKVAVCLPAHNEEEVIEGSIKSIKNQISARQIYVVSDGSTDSTAKIARKMGCNVMVNKRGKGKAKALKGMMDKYELLKKYEYILIVDADTKLDRNYLTRALRFMHTNPRTAALAAHAHPLWHKKFRINDSDFISAYRTRLYKILQLTFMYGQTWKYTNVNIVVPGFAAMYRTRAMEKLQLDTPGIWIEDFNLAFQIHKKKLGTIGYHPSISATYQDPQTIEDYWNQVKRWNVGFFQTIRVHKLWPSLFWASLLLFNFEITLLVFFILLAPLIAAYIFLLSLGVATEGNFITSFFPNLHFYFIETLLGIVIIDYLITIAVAIHDKKYRLMIYGPFFVFFQLVNSLIFISALKPGFFEKGQGKWIHAKRS